MFDAVRSNKRIVQVFLALITLPFAFWGVDSYFRSGGGAGELASVGGSSISRQEFAQTMRDQQERMRTQLGREFNPAMLETPEARQAMLDSLITQRLLLVHAMKSGLTASDAQLIEVISSIPALQEDGRFSKRRYEQALRGQGLTQAGFEAKLRQDLTLQQLVQAFNAMLARLGAETVQVRLPQDTISRLGQNPGVVVQVNSSGTVYGFRSEVINRVSVPAPLLFLSHPDSVERLALRRAERLDVTLPCSIHGAFGDHEVVLLDLCPSGCSFAARSSLKSPLRTAQPGERLILRCDLGFGHTLTVPLTLRRVDEQKGRITMGGQFVDMTEESSEMLNNYLQRMQGLLG